MPEKHRAPALVLCALGAWGKSESLRLVGNSLGRRLGALFRLCPLVAKGTRRAILTLPVHPASLEEPGPCLRVVEREPKKTLFPIKKAGLPRTPLSPLAFETHAPLKAEVAGPQSPFLKQRSKLMSENLREHWSWSHALWVQILPLYVLPVRLWASPVTSPHL